MDDGTKPARLAEHDAALGKLLDSLLAEVPAFEQETPSAARPAIPPAAEQAPDDVPQEPLVATEPVVPAKTPLNPGEEAPLTKHEPGESRDRSEVPEWAHEPFRVLLFRVGELRFAVPLILMRSVTRVPDRLTQVPGQPTWHRGVIRYRGESVVVADLGLLLGLQTSCPDPSHLLVIGDGCEAIGCDAIEEAVAITADDVRWRRSADQRWLPGLLVDQMCGLLDAEVIGREIRHR